MVAGESEAEVMCISLNSLLGEATGIRAIEETESNEVWYNLNGQRIDKPAKKGLYIRNGKKVVKDRNYFPGYVIIEADLRDEIIPVIEACSPGPYLELFARGTRPGWAMWGNQADDGYEPTWSTYANHTRSRTPPPAARTLFDETLFTATRLAESSPLVPTPQGTAP